MRIFITLILIIGFSILNNADAQKKEYRKSTVIPFDLRCEYLKSPLGIDVPKPRISWKLQSDDRCKRGQKQSSYQILVATSESFLKDKKADLWDSGIVKSEESVNIEYNGKNLSDGQECFWIVRVKDEYNKWSEWSNPSKWTMGLSQTSWKGKWIGAEGLELNTSNNNSISVRKSDPWFRKTFTLSEKPQKAIIYVASVGYQELYINGTQISDQVLMPSVSDHKKRARYITYDITKELKHGKNVISLWLGTSWSIFPAYKTDDKPCAPIALVQAEISLSNNRNIQIVSDESWKTYPSPNTLLGYWDAHQFAGEEYDASAEVDGWNKSDFDDSSWKQVSTFTPQLLISSDKTEPNRLNKEIKPVAIAEEEPGLFRVDMGINYVGWFEMEVSGSPGDLITFQFSEREKDSSSYGLRSVYKIGKSGKGIFRNRFNYMSGRWVKISGLGKNPSLSQIKGWMIRPEYDRSGHFHCDQPLMNNIYDATMWTFENLSLGNYVVDCPHRERRGYGGDALATTRPAMGNYSLGAFYTKWMEDWRDVQQVDGNVPYTAPTYAGGGGPSWSGFCITLPWEMYQQYGDKRILEESFPTIERWLNFEEQKTVDDMLARWGGKWSFLGDWLWPEARIERSEMEKQGKALGDTRETLFFNNCHWIYSLETAANIADILGYNSKVLQYRKRADEAKKAVHQEFFNTESNNYVNGLQAYQAMALAISLPPENLREKVWKSLEDEILIKRKGHFWGGITAGSFLFHTLLDNNRNDLLYTMISKEDFPSWGEMLKHDLGTFFEDWECRGSALHSSYLYVGSWFIESLGGIKRPKNGYRQFTIDPWINQQHGPQEVDSYYDSLYGRIVSKWSKEGGQLSLEISIPANTSALLYLRGINQSSLLETGKSLKKSEGISIEVKDAAFIALRLSAGDYKFSADMQ